MLPTELIFACIGLGILATAGVIFKDQRTLVMVKEILSGDSALSGFQRTYLKVYLPAMMADWLQGPFVYALYESYGWSRSDNAMLFVAGFGSSAIFGTFIGSMADKSGRQKFALLYCILYFVSCLTKHVNSFGMLMIGRVTGGIATSLLFSVFDAWLVSENNSRGFNGDQLGSTFSIAIFGNSIVAIAAGQIGQMAADAMGKTELGGSVFVGGYCAPFDVADVFLIVCGYFIVTTWPENFGQTSSSATSDSSSMTQAAMVMQEKPVVLYLGIVCSLFEASMFIFVFNWTPCLMVEGEPNPPFGHIFSSFMIACMLGSRLFSYLTQWMSLERVGLMTMVISMLCHAVVIMSSSVTIRFFAFLLFEACVGMYFPMMGTLKGQVVPENLRSTIYNLYRVPLNSIVVVTLVMRFETQLSFFITTVMLGIAAYGQYKIEGLRAAGGGDFQKLATAEDARELEMGSAAPAAAPTTVGKAAELDAASEVTRLSKEVDADVDAALAELS